MFVCRSSALRRIAWLQGELDRPDVRAVPALVAAYRSELERLQRIPLEAATFSAVWRDIASMCERGLAEPTYPDDRRHALYEMLGAARECSEPGALDRIREDA
jgi:hypothetical protein